MKIIYILLPLITIMLQCKSPGEKIENTEMNNRSSEKLSADLSISVNNNEITLTLNNTSRGSIVIDENFIFFTTISFFNKKGNKYVKYDPDIPRPTGTPYLVYIKDEDITTKRLNTSRFVELKTGESVSKTIKQGDTITYYSFVSSLPAHNSFVFENSYICPNLNDIDEIKADYNKKDFDVRIFLLLANRNNYRIADNYFFGDASAKWKR